MCRENQEDQIAAVGAVDDEGRSPRRSERFLSDNLAVDARRKFPRSRIVGGQSMWVSSEVSAWLEGLPIRPLKGDPEAA